MASTAAPQHRFLVATSTINKQQQPEHHHHHQHHHQHHQQQQQQQQQRILKKPPANVWLHFVAGGTGASVGAVITSPLDVIKTRLQSSLYKPTDVNHRVSDNVFTKAVAPIKDTCSTLRSLYRTEGFRALYKGLGANLVGVVPARAINFFVYGNSKEALIALNGKESPWIHLTSAAAAGIITSTITNPIWLIKTRLQLQSNTERVTGIHYKNGFHCLRHIVQHEGFFGLYKGVTASYLGVTESATQWMVYEQLKKMLATRRHNAESIAGTVVYEDGMRKKSSGDLIDNFFAAGAAKLVASAITYPHEVIRTRLRQGPAYSGGVCKYTGLVQSFSLILKEEGPLALYGGMTAHLMRSVPNAAVMFLCYEVILHWFGGQSSSTPVLKNNDKSIIDN